MRRILMFVLCCSAPALAPAVAHAQTPPAAPVIAPGVTAAGLDLGGLSVADASARLYATFPPILGQPVRVHAGGKTFTLWYRSTRLRFDGMKTARRAYAAGRAAKGARVDVPLVVTYRSKRVKAFAERIARSVATAAHDAVLRITLRHMLVTPGRRGRALDARALQSAVGKVLADPRLVRSVRPKLRTVLPRVTTRGLARLYSTVVTVDRAAFTARLFKRLKYVKSYRVAVGQPAYPTPTGLFHVLDKQVNPVWSVPNSPWAGELAGTTVQGGTAANPLKARWMGLGDGIGFHGTGEDASIGTRASHGCIRMHVPDVIDLYRRVPVGTPVLIGH